MTDLEQRLRHELQTISERADPGSIRPLRLPPVRGRKRLARWLAPVAAVAAVLVVIGGVYLAGHTPGPRPPAAPGVMPPHYVVVQANRQTSIITLTVRDSHTGTALLRERLPVKLMPLGAVSITGAADGRTFLIDDGSDLLLLRLAADGRSARVSRLAVKVPEDPAPFDLLSEVALAPDGRAVAIATQSSCELPPVFGGVGESVCRDTMIRLVSLATGATRTWSTRALWRPAMSISWDGNDHILFAWADASAASAPGHSGYRLLNLRLAGGDLESAPRLPLPPLPELNGDSEAQSAFVTPDQRAVIGSTFSVAGSGGNSKLIMQIAEWSARTWQVTRVLRQAVTGRSGFMDSYCAVLSLAPTGVHALTECAVNDRTVFGRLDNGRFTRLPGMLDNTRTIAPGDAAW
jgi:hypothetical protein